MKEKEKKLIEKFLFVMTEKQKRYLKEEAFKREKTSQADILRELIDKAIKEKENI